MKSDEVIEWVQSLGPTPSKRREVIKTLLFNANRDEMSPEDIEEARLGLSLLEVLDTIESEV